MSPVSIAICLVIILIYTAFLLIYSEARIETELEPYSEAIDEISVDMAKMQEDLKPILEALASQTNQDTKMILYAHKRIDMIVEELKNARRQTRSQKPR
jgi:hypothetical protein